LNKEQSWVPLLLSMFLQLDHTFYFKIVLGDKDTFRMAWKAARTPYYMVQHPVAIAGRIRQGQFCGHTMVQRDATGEILFAHTTSMKSTQALSEGRTWEALQYLDRTSAVPLKSPSENTRAFIVAYPQALEFAGGVEKTTEQGGQGGETATNPCLGWALKNLTVETHVDTLNAWGAYAVDSFRLITENVQTYEAGTYGWFEHMYYSYGGLGSRTDATCGNGRVGNGECANESECCSGWGYCGLTLDHCGAGCVGGPCFKSRKLPDPVPPGFEFCGDGKVGYGICKDTTRCCSRFGYCGDSVDHCKKDNCLSGPCHKE